MGFVDNIRSIFSSSKNDKPVENKPQINEDVEKAKLANNILNSIESIKRLNSFDKSLWNLSNVSSTELKKKSLDELKKLSTDLDRRASELTSQSQVQDESLEASKWTGEKPENMNDHDFDRFQRDDR